MAKIGRLIFILIAAFACGRQNDISQVEEIVAKVQNDFAPDGRTALFEVEVSYQDGYVLSGETNLLLAKSTLLDRLTAKDFTLRDEIVLLPGKEIGANKFGIVNVSVANLRAVPRHSGELVTQALLGMPLSILKKQGGWFLVQTPDKYIAWTNSGGLQVMNQRELSEWKNADKVIYMETYGFVENEKGGRISDLVAGNVLNYMDQSGDYWEVVYPDGRTGRIHSNEAVDLSTWADGIRISDTSIIDASMQLMGVPYLWGGTSTKGVDCSGFTKTVYLLHGLVLPRDASQQVHAGVLIDSLKDFSALEVGDLLFFGRVNADHTERVVHVGMWLGNNQFIHASGDVHISSMDSLDENYDSYNLNRYLRTKRIANVQDKRIVAVKNLF